MTSLKCGILFFLFLASLYLYIILVARLIHQNEALKFNKTLWCDNEDSISNSNHHSPNSRVVNGSEVNEDDLKCVVSVYVKAKFKFGNQIRYQSFCTGSVINPLFVLVASHCLKFVDIFLPVAYVAGGLDHDLMNIFYYPKNYKKIYNFHRHPLYEEDEEKEDIRLYDIGLIELKEPFEFGIETGILPASLLDREIKYFRDDFELIAVGYGNIHPATYKKTNTFDSAFFSDLLLESVDTETEKPIERWAINNQMTKLMKIDFEQLIIDDKKLKPYIRPESKLPYEFIFVNSKYGSVCVGDSGGPLVLRKKKEKKNLISGKYLVAGVLNVGISLSSNKTVQVFCLPDSISVYAPVYPFLNWIGEYVGNNMCIRDDLKMNRKLHHDQIGLFAFLLYASPFIFLLLPYLIVLTLKLEKMKKTGALESSNRLFCLNNHLLFDVERSFDIDQILQDRSRKVDSKRALKDGIKIDDECDIFVLKQSDSKRSQSSDNLVTKNVLRPKTVNKPEVM